MTQQSTQKDTRALMKNALLRLEKLETKLRVLEEAKTEPIAVVGLGCRFPKGVETPDDLWKLLQDGVDAVTEIPQDRWDVEEYYDPQLDRPGKIYCRHASFLNQVDQFDPIFFGISPRETQGLDPQQRLLLEVSWEALENSGIAPDSLKGSQTGVFIGIMNQDYSRLSGYLDSIDMHTGTGNSISAAAGRLSYHFGLNGPSLTVDTACSSSLVTVHMACQSLRNGETNLAIAGGVNLILSPMATVVECRAHMLSKQGRCKTFDASADGFVRGEGCGIVVLKRLSDALVAGDSIWGLIRGTSVNHTGASGGLTVPKSSAQEKLFRQALANGNLTSEQVSYIESHGTGTALGDPIELTAIGNVYGVNRSSDSPLIVGSVKTNFGHLEGAAGIIGLLKAILTLHYQKIPPHLHFKNPNPHISWEQFPIHIPIKPMSWPPGTERHIAGVNSFGFSGTNAHVLIEEAPDNFKINSKQNLDDFRHPPNLSLVNLSLFPFVISAQTFQALKELVTRYRKYFVEHSYLSVGDVCFTANTGRAHFAYRLSLLVGNITELVEKLGGWLNDNHSNFTSNPLVASHPRLVFCFTGQGAQYIGMARELYDTQACFRQALDQCQDILSDTWDNDSLTSILYHKEKHENLVKIDRTRYTQPILFSLEYALAQLWISWGIQPTTVLGHSLGEYVAACVAGVFNLKDALKLVVARSHLMDELPSNGRMIAVRAEINDVELLLSEEFPEASIAAFNAPLNQVISGSTLVINEVCQKLTEKEISWRSLEVSHAFHSKLMEPILSEFRQVATTVTYHTPHIRMISNVTGTWANSNLQTPDYWVDHICQPVRFVQGVQTLIESDHNVFVEIGPKPTLLRLARQAWQEKTSMHWLPSLDPRQSDWKTMLSSLGHLYEAGYEVDWSNFSWGKKRQRLSLPTYPFQRQRYWLSPRFLSKQLVSSSTESNNHSLSISKTSLSEELENKLYEIDWRVKNWNHFASSDFNSAQTWLIFIDRRGIGQEIVAQLQYSGISCYTVTPGNCYEMIAPDRFQVNPAEPEDMIQLLQALKLKKMPLLTNVIHLWSLDTRSLNQNNPQIFIQDQELTVASVFHFLQSLLSDDSEVFSSSRLWLVTEGAQAITTKPVDMAPNQSTLWGLGRAIATEHPEHWGGLVDLEPGEISDSHARSLVTLIQGQTKTNQLRKQREDQIVIREGQPYVARFQALSQKLTLLAPSPQFSSEGTYIITGGLGGLGLQVAKWLVAQGAGHVILLGRSAPSTVIQQFIKGLEKTGASITTAQLDVAKQNDLATLLTEVKKSASPLRGIFHLAGVLDDDVLVEQDWQRFVKVRQAKVEGAWNLHILTQDLSLDFFVLFSSVASVWTLPGQGNYAAANAFLDALAHHRHQKGQVAMSLNWGLWQNLGLTATEYGQQVQSRLSRLGITGLSINQGLELLNILIHQDFAQIGIFSVDWQRLFQGQRSLTNLPLFQEYVSIKDVKILEGVRALIQSLKEAKGTEREERALEYVLYRVMTILQWGTAPPPQPKQSLLDLGLDSLLSFELRNIIQSDLGVDIPLELFVNGSTVMQLAEILADDSWVNQANSGQSRFRKPIAEITEDMEELIL